MPKIWYRNENELPQCCHVYWAIYMMYLEWSEDTQIISPIMQLMMIKFDARIRHTRSCGRRSWWPMRGGYYTQTWVWEQTIFKGCLLTIGWNRPDIIDDLDNDVKLRIAMFLRADTKLHTANMVSAQCGGVSYNSRRITTANNSILRLSYGEYFILVL